MGLKLVETAGRSYRPQQVALPIQNMAIRELAPAVLATLVRRYRDFAACEDALQEALLAAHLQWPTAGVPDDPRAWLTRVAVRRLTDEVRATTARRLREALVVSLVPADEQIALAADVAEAERDDTLELLFMCCHPSLSTASAVALTLRALGGLTTAEIAAAYFVPEATMAQRLARAKATLKAATQQEPTATRKEPTATQTEPTATSYRETAARFPSPDAAARAARLDAVMHVLYLMFNEGYAASSGPTLMRVDLAEEAIRLARMLVTLTRPEADGHAEALGLLALMLLTHARRHARTGPSGELVPLDDQDRTRWDPALIAEGDGALEAALAHARPGPYQIQAAIAALHDHAASWEATDWPQIRALYDLLLARTPDAPMARLSRAIAVAMIDGPRAGLDALDALAADPRLSGHHRLAAARAHLLERLGDQAAARAAYAVAAERTASLAERDYLRLRAARLG